MQALKWKRTMLVDIGGVRMALPDDWCLVDGALSLARIYRLIGGPLEGNWAWFVQVFPDGTPGNGGTGTEESQTAAREACEARLPEEYRVRVQDAPE